MIDRFAARMAEDHEALAVTFREFRNARGARALQLFSRFEAGLRAHIAWEEEVLFPPFEERTGMTDSGPTAVMRVEHEEIERRLQSIRDEIEGSRRCLEMRVPETGCVQTVVAYAIDRDAMAAREKDLLAVLVPHNGNEEGLLYRSLERMLPEGERQALLDRLRSPGRRGPDGSPRS